MSKPNLRAAVIAMLRRDLTIAFRSRGELLQPVFFFLLTLSLFPLAAGAEPHLLARIAPAVIWVGALLAGMLTLERMFRADFHDGTLEQLLLSAHPPSILLLAKTFAHWLQSGAPLVLASPLLAVMMQLPAHAVPTLLLSLLLGTLNMTLLGAAGAALTLRARGGGMLLALLVLPLFVPVLIFGAGAVRMAALGLPPDAQLLWLGALTLLALAFAPPAMLAGLRAGMQ